MLAAMLLLSCCLQAPLEVTVDVDALTVGVVLPLPASDPRTMVSLGYAPNPSLARRIARYDIIAKIQAAGFKTDDLELPESILVRRRSQGLDPQQVRQAVMDAFARQYPAATIELISVDTPSTQVGMGDVTLTASLPGRFDPNNAVFVRLEVRSGSLMRVLYVRSQARIETMQPVLRTHVAANAELKPSDVEFRQAPLQSSGQVPSTLDGLEGMLAKRDLEPGQVLKTDLLYMPLYVRKGETVTVKATAGNVVVAASMRALSAGKLGDTISEQHMTGTGTTTARIVGMRTLEAIGKR